MALPKAHNNAPAVATIAAIARTDAMHGNHADSLRAAPARPNDPRVGPGRDVVRPIHGRGRDPDLSAAPRPDPTKPGSPGPLPPSSSRSNQTPLCARPTCSLSAPPPPSGSSRPLCTYKVDADGGDVALGVGVILQREGVAETGWAARRWCGRRFRTARVHLHAQHAPTPDGRPGGGERGAAGPGRKGEGCRGCRWAAGQRAG